MAVTCPNPLRTRSYDAFLTAELVLDVFSTACLSGRQALLASHRRCKRCRRAIAQAAVRTLFVVLVPPRRDLPPRVEQILKPTRVQAFIPQFPVKTLHKRVLHRPARLDV